MAIERLIPPAPSPRRVKVALDGNLWPFDIRLQRTSDGYQITYAKGVRQRFFLANQGTAGAFLGWLDACPDQVREMTVNATDGDVPSRARFSASSRTITQVPIPDPLFYRHRGFARERATAKEGSGWSARSEDLVWRGAPNGFGQLGFDPVSATDPSVKARIRMVMLLRDQPGCDVRLTGGRSLEKVWREVARSSGLVAGYVPADAWLAQKYAIDIDGWTNTWSNLLVRMLFGCCVFKVDSQLGFRQWYYGRLKPFEHYVPVRADMSDFIEKIEWARSHDAEARAIAEAGQRFAMGLDFEAGRRDAVEIISANWQRS